MRWILQLGGLAAVLLCSLLYLTSARSEVVQDRPGCPHGPDLNKGAPIYILDNGKVVSTVMIKEEL